MLIIVVVVEMMGVVVAAMVVVFFVVILLQLVTVVDIHRVREKGATLFLPITLRIANLFSKFF